MSNPHYVYGKPVPQLMLDADEVKLLEKLTDNRSQGANLSEMIDRLFLLPEDYNQRYPVDKRG
ncbi:hypothetical protein [Enterococcus rotai]|uniref:hypothetical protein n=1 Tax=Enterococcus rotai TaxID=118060 RepID=UPI0032B3D712